MRQAGSKARLVSPRLRTRLVVTFSLVAAVSSIVVAGVSFAVVSRARFGARTETAVSETQFLLRLAADSLPPGATDGDVDAFVSTLQRRGGFEAVVLDGGRVIQTSVALSSGSVPQDLRALVDGGRVAHESAVVDEIPFLVIGGKVLPDGPTFFFFFPQKEITDELRTLARVLAGAAAATVLMAALVGAGAAGGFLRPIRDARDAARRMESGDLTARLPDEGRDEFAELARSFNRMAMSLERSVGDLRSLEARQRRFVSDVSHELRTPLTAIAASAGVLEGELASLPDNARRPAELLVQEIRRLMALVEGLMEISRFDAGAESPSWDKIEVAAMVEGALRIRGLGEGVIVNVPRGLETFADPIRVDAVLGNLLGNALQHGESPVEVSASVDGRSILIEVADSGPGISEAHLPHIFDRFYKGDPSRPRSLGSGLGLAIARENARLMGGDIVVQSRLGDGARFTFHLPLRANRPA